MLEFKNRQRDVWGRYYTELFFLDEVTALAAGHRPCFECRRKDAVAFAEFWQQAFKLRSPPRAGEWTTCCIASGSTAAPSAGTGARSTICRTVRSSQWRRARSRCAADALLQWTPAGYAARKRRPRCGKVDVLTPPAILAVLTAGYRPQWHPSAERRGDRRQRYLPALSHLPCVTSNRTEEVMIEDRFCLVRLSLPSLPALRRPRKSALATARR